MCTLPDNNTTTVAAITGKQIKVYQRPDVTAPSKTLTNWIDRLSEYLDSTLTPEEQSACETWLASNAEGQALLRDLRRVVAEVWRGLAGPGPLTPGPAPDRPPSTPAHGRPRSGSG